jgi:hypothetical protein
VYHVCIFDLFGIFPLNLCLFSVLLRRITSSLTLWSLSIYKFVIFGAIGALAVVTTAVCKGLSKEEEGGGDMPKIKEEVQNEKLDMKLDALLEDMRLLKEGMPGMSSGDKQLAAVGLRKTAVYPKSAAQHSQGGTRKTTSHPRGLMSTAGPV